jgi:Zn-dependent protease with chaperone function
VNRRRPLALFALCGALTILAAHGQATDLPVAVPEPSAKALDYEFTRNMLWAIDLAWGLAVLALFFFTGWSARIRDFAQRLTRGRARMTFVYVVVFTLLTSLFALPLDFIREYVVEHRFGLSEQTLAKWAADEAIGLAVNGIVTFAAVLLIYALLRRSPRRWWLYSGLLAIPFIFAIFLVEPIWVAPLFNKFGPMKDPALESKIHALAERAGIEGARIFEVEKSVDTKKVNAYVAGFLDTKRIVMWDTLLKRLDERQLLFVMGHEMGHYVLHHGPQIVLVLSALVMLSLYGAHRLGCGLIERYGARCGVDRLDDIASWPLISLVAAVVFLVAQPLFNAFTRHLEHEADRFGLEITRDNRAAGEGFLGLQQENLAVPRSNIVMHILRDTHPSLADRIEFANTYKPWSKGEPLVYGDKFRQ